MKFASFAYGAKSSWGAVHDGALVDLGHLSPSLKQAIMADALPATPAELDPATRIPVSDIRWLPVIPDPDKILCVGLNYENHRTETGRSEVQHPTIFVRFANSQIGHEEAVIRPFVSEKLDWEGELAVIIGRPGRHISEEHALAHVAGFSCYNDVTVRDWQRHTHQFTPGKNFIGTGAFGPWMVTADEVGPLDGLRLQTRLNGKIVQDATLGEMIFGVARQIAYCSTFTRLEPGDVIATGTPGGVGATRQPQVWMKAGDRINVSIDKVGTLRNVVTNEVP